MEEKLCLNFMVSIDICDIINIIDITDILISRIKKLINFNLGCYFHGCTCLKKRTKDQIKAIDKWEKKKAILRSKGVEIKLMRECVWDKKLENEPIISETETQMPRILKKNDTEETLLNAIKNDEVFGFAVCSIRTDSEDIEQMLKVC